jgi:hypothetical protein
MLYYLIDMMDGAMISAKWWDHRPTVAEWTSDESEATAKVYTADEYEIEYSFPEVFNSEPF